MPDAAEIAKKYGGVPVGATPSAVGVHPEAKISAEAPGGMQTGISLPGDSEQVTLRDIMDDPKDAFARMGSIMKRELTDPKLWLAAAASYFGPKMFNSAAPVVARAASAAKAGAGEVLTPSMAKDALTVLGGDGRVNAGIRIVDRLGSAMKGGKTPTDAPPPETPAVSTSGKVMNPVGKVTAAADAANVKLTGREMSLAVEAVRDQGGTAKDVIQRLMSMRGTSGSVFDRLPTDADVAATIAARNAKGRW